MLKNLISKEIWIGQIIHNLVRDLLLKFKSGNEVPLGYALNFLRKKLNEDYERSKRKLYKENPKQITGLFEHEYGRLVLKDKWEELFKSAEECLINFYNSGAYDTIKNTPKENWIFLEDFLGFDFEGTQIYLSIDFAIKEGDKVILYDWKTGKESDQEELQLSCYALFILNKWNIPPKNITARVYNLKLNKEKEFVINPELIEKTKDHIRKSIQEMQGLLEDKENNVANKDNFPIEEGPFCGWCNFKKICLKGGD